MNIKKFLVYIGLAALSALILTFLIFIIKTIDNYLALFMILFVVNLAGIIIFGGKE